MPMSAIAAQHPFVGLPIYSRGTFVVLPSLDVISPAFACANN